MQVTRVQSQSQHVDVLNTKAELLHRLKGTIVHLPSLKPVFHNWKGIDTLHINPFYEPLRELVIVKLASLNLTPRKQIALERADLALFAALWWPDIPPEQLKTLANIAIWVFTWDDEVDEPSGSYSEDFNKAQSYRRNTTEFIGISLGLRPSDSSQVAMDRIVQSFDEIGLALRGSYNVDQLQRFYDGISRFISSTEIEQEHQLSGNLPTFQEYMGNRLGTSAVDITNASVEYGLSLHLPSDIMRSESTRTLWRETNLIFSITNDLMSHKKEFETGSVENMLPLAFASTYDIGTAISKLVDSLRASKDRFDQEAKVLTQEAKQHGCCSEVEQYIQVLRSNCVGNLIWRQQDIGWQKPRMRMEVIHSYYDMESGQLANPEMRLSTDAKSPGDHQSRSVKGPGQGHCT